MPNAFKYSPGATANGAIYKGGFLIGNNTADYSGANFYYGITPGASGYAIYQNKVSNGPSIYNAPDDASLVFLTTTQIAGTPDSPAAYTTSTECLNYFAGQTDKLCINRDYEGIITSGLSINSDAGYTPSYPTTGSIWYDISGYGATGTLTNGPTYSSANGGSIVFDGIDDYINLRNPLIAQSFSQITLSVWVKFNALDYVNNTGSLNTFISKGNPDTLSPSSGFWFSYDNRSNRNSFNYTCFGNSNGGYAGGGNNFSGKGYTFTNGLWYNIVATANPASGSLYINGIQIGSPNAFNNLNLSNNVSNLTIGSFGGGVYFINGNILISQIYNTALSSSQILQNYYAILNSRMIVTSGLILNLQAGNPQSYSGSGTSWYDASGSRNNGTLINGPTYSAATGGAISFDGVDDYVVCNNSSVFNLTTNFTLSLTFSFTYSTQYGTLLGKQEGGGYGIEMNTPTVPNAIGGVFYINGAYRVVSDPVSNYSTNVFYNVAITYDGNNFYYYRNGTQVSTTAFSGSVTTTSEPFTLGANPNGGGTSFGGFLNGKIGEVKVYNRTLSAAEILQNYNAVKGTFNL